VNGRTRALPRWLTTVAIGAFMAAALVALYTLADPERRDLDDAARRSAPGQFVRLTDGFTHYDLAGPAGAPLVVLAAGFSVPYYIWDPTFAALSKAGFRVLRYDYYGRGFSDRPDVSYSQSLYVRQLRELVDALHVTQPFDLAGLSFGASVITSFADQYPGRVRSIVYMDPSFRTPAPPPVLAGTPWAWNALTAIVDERGWADSQLDDFRHPERFPDWPARYRVQMQYRGFRRARLSEMVTNALVDQQEEVDRVGQDPRPVLIIWGKQDPNVPFEMSAALLQSMPQGTLLAVDDSGHLPQWEQPAIVDHGLIEFLQRVHTPPVS
jgi:pimeloyl-ACP methyl ester carboxylesterase